MEALCACAFIIHQHYHYRLWDPTKSIFEKVQCMLSFLNFVIRLNDDSGIKESFASLTTEENIETPYKETL